MHAKHALSLGCTFLLLFFLKNWWNKISAGRYEPLLIFPQYMLITAFYRVFGGMVGSTGGKALYWMTSVGALHWMTSVNITGYYGSPPPPPPPPPPQSLAGKGLTHLAPTSHCPFSTKSHSKGSNLCQMIMVDNFKNKQQIKMSAHFAFPPVC